MYTCEGCNEFNRGECLKPLQNMGVCSQKPGFHCYVHRDNPTCFKYSPKSTLSLMWVREVHGYTVAQDTCCVCGRYGTEQHHVPPRSAGNLIVDGKKLKKPTLAVCGHGNTSGCHGLAHAGKLHFRFRDDWEFLLLDEPTDRMSALDMDGWKPIRRDF